MPLSELTRHEYRPAPLSIIEPGVLDGGGKMILVGPAKTYKTMALLHLSFCLASGIAYLSPLEMPSPVKVLYVRLHLPRMAELLRQLARDSKLLHHRPVVHDAPVFN